MISMKPYYEPCAIESVRAAYLSGSNLDTIIEARVIPVLKGDSQKVYFASDRPKTPEKLDLFIRMVSEYVTGRSDLLSPKVAKGDLGHSGHVLRYVGARASDGRVDFNGQINWKKPLLTELEALAREYDFKVELV